MSPSPTKSADIPTKALAFVKKLRDEILEVSRVVQDYHGDQNTFKGKTRPEPPQSTSSIRMEPSTREFMFESSIIGWG